MIRRAPGALFAMALSILAAATALAGKPGEPDHWLMVSVNSTPPGAKLYPADAGEDSPSIGTTPCVIPVELHWGRGLFGRKWSKLRLASPGDSVRARFDAGEKAQEFSIRLRAEREGYETAVFDLPLGSIRKGQIPRHTEAQFPSKRSVSFELAALPQSANPPQVRLLMLSGANLPGEERPTGRLEVRAKPDNLIVQINGKTVGRSPIDIVLHAGRYEVSLQSPGFATHTEAVDVAPKARHVLEPTLLRSL